MLDKRKFYINGEWVDPITPRDLEVINPATEKPIAVISMGTAADIDRAAVVERSGQDPHDVERTVDIDRAA